MLAFLLMVPVAAATIESAAGGEGIKHAARIRTRLPPAAPRGLAAVRRAEHRSALPRAAIRALVSMPRDQANTFAALAHLIRQREEITAAAQALRVLPRSTWPKTEAGATATALVEWAKTIPPAGRTAHP